MAGLCLTTALVACGGSKPEAKEPESSESTASSSPKESSDTPKKDSSGDGDDKSAAKEDKADDGKSAKAEPAEEKKSLRSAKDIITRPDVLFMFSFNESEPHQAADKKCTEKAKDDPKKKADCMSKASTQFDADGMAFLQIDGKWWWLTVRPTGGHLVALHKVEVDFADDSDSKVTIKPHGPDKGSKPGGLHDLVIEVPSESEIAVTDPKLGRLVYQAKMGMMGKSER